MQRYPNFLLFISVVMAQGQEEGGQEEEEEDGN